MPNNSPVKGGSLRISMLAYEQAGIWVGELSVLLSRHKNHLYFPLKTSIDQTPLIPFTYTLDVLVLELSKAIRGNTQREYNKADYLLRKIIYVWEELFKNRKEIDSKKRGAISRVYSHELICMLRKVPLYIANQQAPFSTEEYLREINNGSAVKPGLVALTDKEIAKRKEHYLVAYTVFNSCALKS